LSGSKVKRRVGQFIHTNTPKKKYCAESRYTEKKRIIIKKKTNNMVSGYTAKVHNVMI
jgi:hypothetical protein